MGMFVAAAVEEKKEEPVTPVAPVKPKTKPTPPLRKSKRKRGRPPKAAVPLPTSDTEEDDHENLPEMLPDVEKEDEKEEPQKEEEMAVGASEELTNSLTKEVPLPVPPEDVIVGELVETAQEVGKDEFSKDDSGGPTVGMPSAMPLEVMFTATSDNSGKMRVERRG